MGKERKDIFQYHSWLDKEYVKRDVLTKFLAHICSHTEILGIIATITIEGQKIDMYKGARYSRLTMNKEKRKSAKCWDLKLNFSKKT